MTTDDGARGRLLGRLRDLPTVVETPRLRLVAGSPDLAGPLAAALAASLPELRFLPGWRKVADLALARDALAAEGRAVDEYVVRHALTPDGDYVARLDLHSWDADVPACELGYLAATPFTGRGLVTEAAAAMLDLAWSLGCVRVQATCDPRNVAAVALAERLGMRREGLREACERDEDGALCDEVMLAVVRRDPGSVSAPRPSP